MKLMNSGFLKKDRKSKEITLYDFIGLKILKQAGR